MDRHPVLRVFGECTLEHALGGSPAPPTSNPVTVTLTQRRMLSRLALDAGHPVTIDELRVAIWPDQAPQRHRQALQNQISRLRASWGEHLIVTHPEGYALNCVTDVDMFLEGVTRAESLLELGENAAAFTTADAAIALFRGRPYADLEHLPEIAPSIHILSTALSSVEDIRLEAAIRLGRPAWATIEAERLHAGDPLNERRQALRVRALVIAGRRGDALAAASIARSRLRNDLGIEPGPWLAAAEAEALGALTPSLLGSPVPEALMQTNDTEIREPQGEELLRGALEGLSAAEAGATARGVAAAANQNGEHREAVLWLSRALELPDIDPHTRLMLRIELGDAQRLAGDPAHLGTLIDAAREALQSGDEHAIAEACFALLQLGASTTSGHPIPEVRTIIERALLKLSHPEHRAPVLAAASLASSLIGTAARSRELFTEALELTVSAPTRARILPFAYMALGAPADLPLRRQVAHEITQLSAQLGDAVIAFEAAQLRFSVALQDADGAQARASVTDMARLVHQVGDAGRQWAVLFARAAIAHLDGDSTRCEQITDQAQRFFTTVSPARAGAAHAGQLIILRVTDGTIAQLAPMLTGLATAQPGIPAFQAAAALASAEIDVQAAVSRAELALDLAQHDATWLAGHAIGGRASALLGDRTLAERYLERLLPWSGLGIWQGTCSYGPVDTPIALLYASLGDLPAAATHAARARSVAQQLQAAPFLAELDRVGLP